MRGRLAAKSRHPVRENIRVRGDDRSGTARCSRVARPVAESMDPLRDRFGEGEAEHRGSAGEPLRREAGTNHSGIVERGSELGEATALGLVEAADQDRHAGRPHRTAARCAERPHGEAGLCSRGGIPEDREDQIVANRVGFSAGW